ncbi:uncharacterized protein [Typha angustifolia]|uniref:uncharacterized protein isoform X3 n=1 Tax=Typha angustifolia TaxID=59011 RepID=UPI003C2B9F26
MTASLLHSLALPLSRRSFAIPHQRPNCKFKIFVRFGVLGLPRGGLLKLRYVREELVPPTEEDLQGRSNMLDKAYIGTDGMDDLERQLQDFFIEIKTKLEMGNKDDAKDLLQANYESVKEQIEDGVKGIEQAAVMDIIALGYMGIGNDNPLLIPPLMGMAKVFTSIGRSTKAIVIYHRAVGILEKTSGKESKELVVPLFGLGNLLINVGKAAEAETCFSRILEIYKEAYGENDGRTGMAMCSFAHALCATGNVEEAIHMYNRGLQVIKDTEYMASDDDVLEKMKTDLAELLHVTGREQEGRELLQECLLITEKYKGIEHPNSVTHLLNLATSHSRSKNFVEAERLLRTCLHIMSRALGPNDQALTVPLLHLAVTLYHLKQNEEAEVHALEALRIREDAFGMESLPVGEALDCLVSIQARLEKDDRDILDKLKRILSIQEKEMGYESEEVMITLKKIVFYLDKMGMKDEKLPLQRRLSILRTKFKQKIPV